jgi:hypothetical protein
MFENDKDIIVYALEMILSFAPEIVIFLWQSVFRGYLQLSSYNSVWLGILITLG